MLGLLDSGATHVCISSASWDFLQDDGFILRPCNKLAKVASGGNAEITGIVKLKIVIGAKQWTGDVYLVKNLPFPLLLGMNFLKDLKVELDFYSRMVTIRDDTGTSEFHTVSLQSLTVEPVHAIVEPIELENGDVINLGAGEDENEEGIQCDGSRKAYEPEEPEPPSEKWSCVEPILDHPNCTAEQLEEFQIFLGGWKKRFEESPGKTTLAECKLYPDPSQPPVKERNIRLSPEKQNYARKLIQDMYERGIIRPSQSQYRSPAFLVPKKEGTWRLVVNYKKLNDICKHNSIPLPYIDEMATDLRNCVFFSRCDMESGFWQVPMAEESKHLTAFSIDGCGFWEFNVMPFGLSVAPGIYQSLMEKALRPILGKHTLVFIDDTLTKSKTFEEHIKNLNEYFTLVFDAGLKINWTKCEFLKPEVDFLGFVMGSGNVKVGERKIGAVSQFPVPKNAKQLRSFLGLVSWFRRFIPNLSDRSKDLNELTQMGVTYRWEEKHQKAFEDLKKSLVEAPVLATPDPDRQFEIHTDASGYGLGAALIQRNDKGHPRPIAFISRSLTKAERVWSTMEREILAVLFALEKFKHYLHTEQQTVVVTDSSSILWLHSLKNPSGRLARWICQLSPYDLKFKHNSGKLHYVPDALSRAPVDLNCVNLCAWDPNTIQDKWYLDLMQKVQEKPDCYPAYQVKDNILWKVIRDPLTEMEVERMVIPKENRQQLMHDNHDAKEAGHGGIRKTCDRLLQRYYWPGLRKEVRKYVKGCEQCQVYKESHQLPGGHMELRETILKPFQVLNIDIAGPLPMTGRKYRFILVCVDQCSKYVIAKPLRRTTAKEIIDVIRKEVVLRYGGLEAILSDNASYFSGKEFKKFCEEINCKLHLIPRYNPSSNPCERYVKTVKTMVSMYCEKSQKNWDQDLDYVNFAINTTTNDTTGFTPARLIFGRELRSPYELHSSVQVGGTQPFDPGRYDKQQQEIMERIRVKVKEATLKAKKHQQKHYNTRHRKVDYPVGALVWRKSFVKSSGADDVAAKLSPKYQGPYKITHKYSHNQVEISDLTGKGAGKWHIESLKPFHAQ